MPIQARLCQHYCTIGIHPKQAARISSLACKWINHSGVEWAMKRLKSLNEPFRQCLTSKDGSYTVPTGWATRKNRRGEVIFSDGLIHSILQDVKSPAGLKKAQSFFRSYQILEYKEIPQRERENFKERIERSLPNTDRARKYSKAIDNRRFALQVLKEIPRCNNPGSSNFYMPMSIMPLSREKKSPVVELDYKGRYVSMSSVKRTDIRARQVFDVLSNDTQWIPFCAKHQAEVSKAIFGKAMVPMPVDYHADAPNCIPAGRIAFLREPGCKIRSIANPSLCIQQLGYPLKRRLDELTQSFPNVYTHDQHAGRMKIAEWLSVEDTVYSFDASAFTDRFPYQLQRDTLRILKVKGWVTQFDIDLCDIVARKQWQTDDGTMVQWNVGQPMGFNPSFHLATITHAFVLERLRMDRSIPRDSYAIVGDDIAINNTELASLYQKFMNEVGVKINLSKSMVSDEYAEFCGKIISERGPSPVTKVKLLETPDQLARYIDVYGRKGLWHLNDQEVQWAFKLILPRELGGLGITPEGMTYSQYVNDVLDVDRIQVKLILDSLSKGLKPISQVTVEKMLHQAADFYESVDLGLSNNEVMHLFDESDNVHISGWSGFPEPNPGLTKEELESLNSNQTLTVNTFRDLVDNANRQILSDETKDPGVEDDRVISKLLPPDVDKYLHSVTGEFDPYGKVPLSPIQRTTEREKEVEDEEDDRSPKKWDPAELRRVQRYTKGPEGSKTLSETRARLAQQLKAKGPKKTKGPKGP